MRSRTPPVSALRSLVTIQPFMNLSLNPMTHTLYDDGGLLSPLPRGEGQGEGQTGSLRSLLATPCAFSMSLSLQSLVPSLQALTTLAGAPPMRGTFRLEYDLAWRKPVAKVEILGAGGSIWTQKELAELIEI
jgi:hypothetical protein